MRKTGQNGLDVLEASGCCCVALASPPLPLGIAVVLSSGVARAQDAEEDDSTFEEKIIKNLMSGIGATNMDNKGIEYRERSPLVIPPKIDLPPPGSAAAEIKDPNWPKDPDVQRRKAAVAARKKTTSRHPRRRTSRILTRASSRRAVPAITTRRAETEEPGKPQSDNPSLSPSQLGFTGKLSEIVRRQQDRRPHRSLVSRTGKADAAADGLSDPVAEFRLRHRAEGGPRQQTHRCQQRQRGHVLTHGHAVYRGHATGQQPAVFCPVHAT